MHLVVIEHELDDDPGVLTVVLKQQVSCLEVTAVSCQLSAVSCQLSRSDNCQLSAVSCLEVASGTLMEITLIMLEASSASGS